MSPTISAKRSERGHAGDCANERSIADLALDLLTCPNHLPINIGADYAE
jgi:hypothetical protein